MYSETCLKQSFKIERETELLKPCGSLMKVCKGAKIRNRYNQVGYQWESENSQLDTTTRAKRSALSQQVTTGHI